MINNKLINILYEDDHLVAINKPAGLLTIPDRYNAELPCLIKMLRKDGDDILVVHRLDRDTSGVILFAKTAEAHRHLSIQFEKQQVVKFYHAVVGGIVPKDELEIDIPLIQNPGKGGGVLPSIRGKESLSIVRVMERFRVATLLEVNLVTGRQHQLRAHVASIGHPLLVDELYGEKSEFFLSSVKRKFNLKKNDVEQPIISRISMHSHSVEFAHPASEEKMKIEADYPKDFRVLINILRKYSSME